VIIPCPLMGPSEENSLGFHGNRLAPSKGDGCVSNPTPSPLLPLGSPLPAPAAGLGAQEVPGAWPRPDQRADSSLVLWAMGSLPLPRSREEKMCRDGMAPGEGKGQGTGRGPRVFLVLHPPSKGRGESFGIGTGARRRQGHTSQGSPSSAAQGDLTTRMGEWQLGEVNST
jgi:hypothetical protein